MENKDFFKFQSVEDFDKHIELSIPNYSGLIDIVTALHYEFMHPHGTCLDIGCSTGKLLNNLPKINNCNYVGCDIVNMVESPNFIFKQDDCLEILKSYKSLDVIFSIFTLQFLGKHKRKQVLDEIKKHIENGSVCIIAEKVYSSDARVESILRREHVRQKRKGFTSDEILDKDYQLFGSMYCNDTEQMENELKYLGKYEQIWQSYNFKSWIVY